MKHVWFYRFPVGEMGIAEADGAIARAYFVGVGAEPEGFACSETPLLARAAAQLDEYFRGERRVFDLPLAPRGTPFQQSAWRALREIPYGETRAYGEIAARIGKPKATRAVGRANNRNPIAIVIPCHRVIGADGSLTGYAGGLDAKALLLALERGGAGA